MEGLQILKLSTLEELLFGDQDNSIIKYIQISFKNYLTESS